MKLGYPCINRSLPCRANRTFRLASYSDERLRETLQGNLACLGEMVDYNVREGLLALRIGSEIVPFASHPVCTFDWREQFADDLARLGRRMRRRRMRISMHPDQFVVLNSLDEGVVERSIAELVYHADFLDSLDLPRSAKVQIHVGGVYGDKPSAIDRFCRTVDRLPAGVRNRLVVENDDRLYSLQDCLAVHSRTGLPIVFDTFHHECLNSGESLADAAAAAAATWKRPDGPLMVDYSSQAPDGRKGAHTESIVPEHFRDVMRQLAEVEFDLMLEIKDKETSAKIAKGSVG